eukprot:14146515-Ditylum_brightwellii.AAC.1
MRPWTDKGGMKIFGDVKGEFLLAVVREDMLDIRIILIIIDFKIPNDVKVELTQTLFGKMRLFAMRSPISLWQEHGTITSYAVWSQSWRSR